MKQSKDTQKVWETTATQFLLRHKSSGRYYVRAFAGGKEVWKSLKTKHRGLAEARLGKFLSQHRQNEKAKLPASADDRRLTFGQTVSIHLQNIADGVAAGRVKASTQHYWQQIFAAIKKSWPELWGRELRRITEDDCESWARQFVRKASRQRFNNSIGGLKNVFAVGIEKGAIFLNPADKLERVPIRQRQLELPTQTQFLALVEAIGKAGGGCSRDCADFVEGLATTGLRKSEAAEVEWRDLDFEKGEAVIRGNDGTATKNWRVHRVPMIPRARQLFERMRAGRAAEPLTEKVFRVREAQRSIDHACKKLGVKRITHHDLRHLFATTCIESGVDIPTVSRWLNHKDGGILAMKTYGHLRNEHSLAQAKRVTFGEVEQDLSGKTVKFAL
jgi:integrase